MESPHATTDDLLADKNRFITLFVNCLLLHHVQGFESLSKCGVRLRQFFHCMVTFCFGSSCYVFYHWMISILMKWSRKLIKIMQPFDPVYKVKFPDGNILTVKIINMTNLSYREEEMFLDVICNSFYTEAPQHHITQRNYE
ncbi:unnamed protein product [Vicia faba]|uniref:Uncharacterized protein n=1 Tax=Vicia faba TaxID=3906 RepID=A0AAV0ZY37_VICFA|nr:unnamed protein product [Vicia faba]